MHGPKNIRSLFGPRTPKFRSIDFTVKKHLKTNSVHYSVLKAKISVHYSVLAAKIAVHYSVLFLAGISVHRWSFSVRCSVLRLADISVHEWGLGFGAARVK